MRVLLDTQTALWWVNEHEKLSSKAQELLRDISNQLYISVVSMWEVAIKTSTGKLYEFEGGIRSFMKQLDGLPIHQIPILPRHIVLVEDLPFIHRDPFDRLLIATAKQISWPF